MYMYMCVLEILWNFDLLDLFMSLLHVLTEMCFFLSTAINEAEKEKYINETTNTVRKLHPGSSRKVHYGKNPDLILL